MDFYLKFYPKYLYLDFNLLWGCTKRNGQILSIVMTQLVHIPRTTFISQIPIRPLSNTRIPYLSFHLLPNLVPLNTYQTIRVHIFKTTSIPDTNSDIYIKLRDSSPIPSSHTKLLYYLVIFVQLQQHIQNQLHISITDIPIFNFGI